MRIWVALLSGMVIGGFAVHYLAWPGSLWALLALLAFVGVYAWLRRRMTVAEHHDDPWPDD